MSEKKIKSKREKCTFKYFCVNCLVCWSLIFIYFRAFLSVCLFFHGNRIFLFQSFHNILWTWMIIYGILKECASKHLGSCYRARLMHWTFFFFLILLYGYKIAHFSKYQRKRRSHNKKILEPYIHAVCMLKGKETDAAERQTRTKAKKKYQRMRIWETVKNECWLNCRSPLYLCPHPMNLNELVPQVLFTQYAHLTWLYK